MVIDMAKSKTTINSEIDVEAPAVEIAEPSNVDNFEVPASAEPVNHTQTEDAYELPSVNPAPVEAEPVAEAEPAIEMTNDELAKTLRALATNHPHSTTGYEVDACVERFLSSDDKPALKYRLGCLAAEAKPDVAEAIAEILKVVG